MNYELSTIEAMRATENHISEQLANIYNTDNPD